MKTLAKILGIGALTLVGCATEYSREDINRIPEKNYKILEAKADEPIENKIENYEPENSQNLPYKEAMVVLGKYAGKLPVQRLTLYLNGEERKLDTTGPMNQYADELKALEAIIPDNQKKASWVVGNKETGGLLALEYQGEGSFILEVEKSNNIISGKQTYTAKVTGRQKEFKARESDNEWAVVLSRTGIDTGIGAAFGVPLLGVTNIIDWIAGSIDKKSPYKNNFISDDTKYIGLDGKTADVISMLRRAKDVGADTIALSNEDGNLSAVYTKNSEVWTGNAGELCVKITEDGENMLEHMIKSTLTGAAIRAMTEKNVTKIKKVQDLQSGVTGTGGGSPGGGNPTPSGGTTGSGSGGAGSN